MDFNNLRNLLLIIGLALCLPQKTQGQDLSNEFKNWYGINLNYDINDPLRLKFGALLSQNTAPRDFSFAQGKLALSYKIKRRTYAEVGYVRLLLNDSQARRELYEIEPGMFDKLEFDRLYARFSYKHDIVKRLSLNHRIESQFFLPAVQKHKTRYVYGARLAYNVRKSSFSPYLESQLFYYSGGVISNGIKRFRLKPGVSFKIFKDTPLRTSVYMIFQDEFNQEQLSENDYNVIGFSMSYTLN